MYIENVLPKAMTTIITVSQQRELRSKRNVND